MAVAVASQLLNRASASVVMAPARVAISARRFSVVSISFWRSRYSFLRFLASSARSAL